MRVLVIRHHDVDTAGFIAEAFEARGASLDVHLFPDDGPLPGIGGADHIVVMGSVSSVNDPDPWIAEELDWIRAADQAGVPVLGICFGAQALCAALGGRVEAMEGKEIGWFRVDSADEDAVPAGPWLEFHNDRCLLPAHATVLARNEAAVQAFRTTVWGIEQQHLRLAKRASAAMLADMGAGDGAQIAERARDTWAAGAGRIAYSAEDVADPAAAFIDDMEAGRKVHQRLLDQRKAARPARRGSE